MNRVALDTNILTQIMSGNYKEIEQKLDNIDVYYIPWVVYSEMLSGIKSGNNSDKYLPKLEAFTREYDVETSSVSGWQTAAAYSTIYTYLKKQGTPVSPNDLWIAAECATLGLPLFTLDTDFKRVPQILLF